MYCVGCQAAVFCKQCITDWTKTKKECPNCRTDGGQYKALAENRHLLGLLKTIKLYCRYRPRGCDDIMTYDQFEEHQKECGVCRLCNSDNIVKKHMFSHYLEDCLQYLFRCQFCGLEGTREELTQRHRCY